jgi:GTP-binding protein lepA
LDEVIKRIKSPKVFESNLGNISNQELKALVFDSQYDPYR